MKDIGDLRKIAVLIDADNAQCSKMKLILEEISAHGHIIVKRAYGDWSSDFLKKWKKELNELVIQPIQQFAYTTGKNCTDTAMIIDAMDLLYTAKFDAFVLVSSDSDFTRLASRLRESEIFVFGVGEKKTPISFRNVCDDFIFTENISETDTVDESNKTKKEENNNTIKEIRTLLDKAWEIYHDDEGWVNVSSAGQFIKRAKPDFDPRSYGFSKLPDLVSSMTNYYEMTKYPGKGTVIIIAYKLKGNRK